MIFDTHTHYDDQRYDSDREAVLASLAVNGVGRIVNVAADMDSVRTTLALAGAYPFVYAAIGVHPDGVAELTEADLSALRAHVLSGRAAVCEPPAEDLVAAGERKIVAIGEIGLDYYGRELSPDIQKEWFSRQLALAAELELPVIVHSREAARDTYEILKAGKTGERAGIVHCFSYSKEMARQFLDLGYYIGLGGVVTFKNARVAKEVAAYVPLDRLLLETDCPYMAPVPYRGARNESGYLSYVAEAVAALRGIQREEVEAATFENACRLYGIPTEA